MDFKYYDRSHNSKGASYSESVVIAMRYKILPEIEVFEKDAMRTTSQVKEVNKHPLNKIPKEAEERRIENQPQTGKNEKAIEPF